MKVILDSVKLKDSYFLLSDGNGWTAKTLIKATKKQKVETFDLQLIGLDIGGLPWKVDSIKQFSEHMIRVNKADMKYPIILDTDGTIVDGWHRVVKALVDNKTTVKAVRLNSMPKYDILKRN